MALTILYDGDCGFCAACAETARRRLGAHPVAIQSPTGVTLLADLDVGQRLSAFHVVSASGKRWTGGAALAPLARELPLGRPLAGLLERFPRLADRAYRLVAGNRHRLSSLMRTRACPSGNRRRP
ncbi:MAG: DUF393 domain-containing protein [Gaiellales bacterium]